jgi:hypothetical protein
MFIESICNDTEVLEQNYRYKMRFSPDYQGVDTETVRRARHRGGVVWCGVVWCGVSGVLDFTTRRENLDPALLHQLTTHPPNSIQIQTPKPPQNPNIKQALADFLERIRKYEQVYEPIGDRRLHYIKLIDMCARARLGGGGCGVFYKGGGGGV